MTDQGALYICWTTVSTQSEAEQLAGQVLERRLAACVQIDAPIQSLYLWKDEMQNDKEYRVWLKTHSDTLDRLTQFIHEIHPYDTPQWLCVAAEKVGEKYLKWATEVSNLRGFP